MSAIKPMTCSLNFYETRPLLNIYNNAFRHMYICGMLLRCSSGMHGTIHTNRKQVNCLALDDVYQLNLSSH